MPETISISKTKYNRLTEIEKRFKKMRSTIASDIFDEPPTKNKKEVIDSFRETGKYNDDFLQSLEVGLSESSYFSK